MNDNDNPYYYNPPDVRSTRDLFESISSMSNDKLNALLTRCRIFNGIVLHKPGAGRRAFYSAFKPFDFDMHDIVKDNADTSGDSVDKVTNDMHAALYSHGYESAGGKLELPLGSFSFGYNQDSSNTDDQDSHIQRTVARHLYPKAEYDISINDLQLDETFIQGVERCLSDSDPKAAFDVLFQNYGLVFPLRGTLGGRANKVDSSEGTSAAMQAALEDGGASANVGTSTDDKTSGTYKHEEGHYKMSVQGGDPSYARNIPMWISSLADSQTWQCSSFGNLRSLVEMLPKDIKARVKGVIGQVEQPARPLQGMWVKVKQVASSRGSCSIDDVAIYEPVTIPTGWCFVGQTYDDSDVLLIKTTSAAPLPLIPVSTFGRSWSTRSDHPWRIAKLLEFELQSCMLDKDHDDTYAVLSDRFDGPNGTDADKLLPDGDQGTGGIPLEKSMGEPIQEQYAIPRRYLIEVGVGAPIWSSRETQPQGYMYPVRKDPRGHFMSNFRVSNHLSTPQALLKTWLIDKDQINIIPTDLSP